MVINLKKKYPHLWAFFRKRKWAVLSTCLVLLGQAVLVIFLPLPVGFIFDKIIKSSPDKVHDVILKGLHFGQMETFQALIFLCVIGFAASFLMVLFEWLEQMITTQAVFGLNEEVRVDLFNKVFGIKQSYLDSKKKVDVMGRISGDVTNMEVLFVTGIRAIVNSVPTICFILVMMFSMNTEFTLRFCLALPVFAFLINYFSNRLRNVTKIFRRETVVFETETHEAVSSLPILKSFSGDSNILGKLLARTRKLTKANENVRNAAVGLDISAGAAFHIVRAILVFLGSLWVFEGRLTTGDLIIFISYVGSFMKPVNDIIKFSSKLPKCIASMDRLEDLYQELKVHPEVSGSEKLTLLERERNLPVLSFRSVTFGYPQAKKLFENASFDFHSHSLVGIVGQSGNGKTTFSRLVNRLHDPLSGLISIGGQDVRQLELKHLRRSVRVLSQDPFLISGSVRENLLLACHQDLPDSDLLEALDAVNALQFVQALPQGLDTQIGDGGQQISGGQAKRIHLARAFLNTEASIFIFDEPTMGLDTVTAQKAIESVKELAKKKQLVFWITHRMEEVHLCSSVLFFASGGNPIHSTHSELSVRNSQYRSLLVEQNAPSESLDRGSLLSEAAL
jgi:ABC-type multidrug transport system fused ATPase/permease subunit